MPIPYEERRKRREALRKSLLPGLQPHIALRNVEAVSQLSTETQTILLSAIQKHKLRIADAIVFLNTNPQATVDEVVEESAKDIPVDLPANDHSFTSLQDTTPDPEILAQIADLLQTCFADLPRISAEALAASEAMSDLVIVQTAHQQVFASPHANTDFVLVAFQRLLQQSLVKLDRLIAGNIPIRQMALSTDLS